EMATGRKAFEGASPVSIMSAILTSDPPPISTVRPVSPPLLDRLVRTCLAKDPEDRWQTARDVELQLAAIVEAGTGPQGAGAAPTPAARKRWLPWLVAAMALVIATIAAVAWVRARAAKLPPPPVIR